MTALFQKRAPRALVATLLSAACLLATPAFALRANAETADVFVPADSLEGNYLAAYIAGAARDTAAAAAFYREAVAADPRNADLVERAFVAFLADGEMSDAFRAADRIIRRDPENGLAHLALGVQAMKAGRFTAARKHLQQGGRGRAADLTATLLAAWSYAGAKNPQRAMETVDRLKGERGFDLFRDYHGGLLAAYLGRDADAEKRLKGALDEQNTALRIVDAYARLQAQRGRKESAIETYRAFEQVMPRHPVVVAALEKLQAGKPLELAIKTPQEGAAEVLYALGSAGNSQGDELPAIIYLRLALHLDPSHEMAMVTLGDIFERMKQHDRAIDVYRAIPVTAPVRPNADIQIGLALEQLGRSEEAVAHLETLAKERPKDVEVLTALGNVLRARKRFAEAAVVYTRAIDDVGTPDRSHWTLFYFRGSSYERSKQWPKAEADLRKALELVPETSPAGRAQVLNYLGYSWVDMGTNIDEAFRMLKKAVELSPRDGMIIDSLGWAYYRLGRYEDAVRELEKAIELKPGDPVVNDHLGDAYWKVGRKLEAKFQWRHALDSAPEPEDKEKIERKLAEGMEPEAKPASAETAPAEPVESKNGG